jgi:hypothetical protein
MLWGLTRKNSATAGGNERGKLSSLFHKIKRVGRRLTPALNRDKLKLFDQVRDLMRTTVFC